ncbi:single-stranded DNA-binding protein [Legionella feeleii]|uniref:Single-stranded DNA-binding protein n=1 Tax=Legionella feeleii TaxID=453 RepID=A0A0W0TH26_9GAMM|nr:single-stranded DNA-binding protein [Legionella feeleii]KTC94887.1 single strand DNA binding protein [Legionella feeleii]SPX62029.1 single-strand DNA-binding protein [Legionella feeleii]
MAVLNKVQLIGHVGHSPKTTQTRENHPVASVSLATNESYRRNDEWETVTEWHSLVFFGKLANFAVERLQKGSQIYIEGKLRSNSWTDAEGVKRQSFNIVVQSIQLLDSARLKELPEQTDKPTAEEYLTQMHSLLECDDVPF